MGPSSPVATVWFHNAKDKEFSEEEIFCLSENK